MTDAKATTYDLAVLFGKPVLFVDLRIDTSTLPTGLHSYELRHSDEDWGKPATMEKQVAVNFFGAIISQTEIPCDKFLQINDGDFMTEPYETATLDQYIAGTYQLTPPPESEIKVVIVEPMKPPREVVILNTLEAYQSTVGGYIETISPFPDEVVLIVNEEGKINGLPPNRVIWDSQSGQAQDILFGTFIVVGQDHKNSTFASLTPEQVKTYMRKFAAIEVFVIPEKNKSDETQHSVTERQEVSL